MASIPQAPSLSKYLLEPLRGPRLAACAIMVWLAGAGYCHGYQRLLQRSGAWSGSLTWSAIAVVPWFALFEWSKQRQGSDAIRRPAALIALVASIAALSIALEYLVHFCAGADTDRLALLVMRRMPAVGATLLLIALARKSARRPRVAIDTASLATLAKQTEYVAAADNYVELHFRDRAVLRRITLSEAADALRDQGFVRIHRRYLVNREHVRTVHANGRGIVRLTSGTVLPVGQAFAANIAALSR